MTQYDQQIEIEKLGAHVMALEIILRALMDTAMLAGMARSDTILSAFDHAESQTRAVAERMPADTDIYVTRVLEVISRIRHTMPLLTRLSG